MREISRFLFLILLLLALQLACAVTASPAATGSASTSTATKAAATRTPTSTPVPLGQIAYSSDRAGAGEIIVMDLASGKEHGVTAASGSYYRPVWSPDGRHLAVRMDITMEGGSGIAVLDVRQVDGKLTGSEPAALVRAFVDSPTWSADGNRVAYVDAEGSGGWRGFSVDLSGSSPQPLPGIPENATDLDWSPDGERLVFSYYENSMEQIRDLYVIRADGSGLTRLTNTPNIHEDGPRWSPDGRQIVFSAREYTDDGNGSADIYRMISDGSGVTRVTSDPADEFDPSWSPDGGRIAFVSDRYDYNDGNYEIFLIRADGTGETRLTNNRSTDRWPAWRNTPEDMPAVACQPGAQFVADVSIPAGTRFARAQDFSKAWRIANSGSCAWPAAAYALRFWEGEQMDGPDQIATDGAIQPGDSTDLVVPLIAPGTPGPHSGKWVLYDGDGRPVPGPDGNPFTLMVSIEGQNSGQAVLPAPLYYLSGENGGTQIWRMETDAATVRQITAESAALESYDISPADESVAFVSQRRMYLADRNGSNQRLVADPGSNPVWSPDGRSVAYAAGGIHVYDVASGQDRMLITNVDNGPALGFTVYRPVSWSPDGTRILASIGFYEGEGLGILSVADGSILANASMENMVAWNNDSRTVFVASSGYRQMGGMEPGLWQVGEGNEPLALIRNALVWWPHQRSDGRLVFFISQSADGNAGEYPAHMMFSMADGNSQAVLRTQPLLLDSRDLFQGAWAADGSSIAARILRPAIGVDEVLLIPAGEEPPVYLMRTGSDFHWGK
jgi:TolB protein